MSKQAFVKSHGIDIYYEMHGQGEQTIVFAHGMGGNAAIWFKQIEAFHKDYQIIVFDHRYFARSKCSVAQFEPAKFSDDIIAILDKEKIQSAIFVCQSMGGWTGSQMAVHHSDRVDCLVMSHTPGIFYHSDVKNNQDIAALVDKFGDAYATPALGSNFVESNLEGAILYAQISNFNGIENSVIPQKIAEADIGVNTDSLIDYRVPTLFITGDLDLLFPATFIEALSKKLPNAQCCNLGEVGHSSYFEKPEAFNKVVKAFIEGLA